MSISGTFVVGAAQISATSGAGLTATQTITYALTGDGASTSFLQDILAAGAASVGMGLPVSVTATITKQQTTGTPPAWVSGKVYALNAQIGAPNGTIQQATTGGTSFSGVWTANTTYTTNQQVFDPYGNIQVATVGGMSGTSLPGNFAPNMGAGVITQDNGVTWTCSGNVYPPFSATPTQTTADNSVVWTCEGTNSVVPGYDAPIITPTLNGSVLTLSFNEALKAPGATNTDAYGTVFTYTTWAVVVTLHYSATTSTNVPVITQNAAWTSGTALNTALATGVLGSSSVTVQLINSGTLTGGQVFFEVSNDNANWFAVSGAQSSQFGANNTWTTANGNYMWQFNVSGYSYFRTRLGVVITGSGTVTVTQVASEVPITNLLTAGQPFGNFLHTTLDDSAGGNAVNTTVKGTQGARALAVQELKDSGRTYVSFTATAAAGVIAEALLSLSQNKQGVVTGGITSYTVTSGKTLRITSISISCKSAAAAIAFTRLSLRHNPTGATIATSPVAYLIPEVNTNSATSGTSAWITVEIPDGIEFFGNGTQTIGVSHLDQATTNILNVTIYGYEY